MTPIEELELLLRPAGGGIYVVSTGRSAQLEMQKRLYGARDEAEVQARFEQALAAIAAASTKVIVLGIPSDVGAGYRRGANLGPQAIRAKLLEDDAAWPEKMKEQGIVDIGDVLVVPQLLDDAMLSEGQIRASRASQYPGISEPLPVSPLSKAERVLDLALAINPKAKPLVFGGDHSCAWPAVAALHKQRSKEEGEGFGIVQIDAHTDLLEERLGIRICFATWSWHANELLGRNGKLVQVGIRATRHDRGHWEKTLGVKQFWANECHDAKAIDAILDHVQRSGVRSIYFSNDIDGTDEKWADATGTPEPNGLTPDFVTTLIDRLADRVPFIGADLMEVAPPLSPSGTTLQTSARYVRMTIDALTRG